jgi:glycosyltransferase involved in cell wall biosynthesis
MGIKKIARKSIEKFVHHWGYKMVKVDDNYMRKNPTCISDTFPFIVNDIHVPFSMKDYQNRDKDVITVTWVIPPLGPGSGGHLDIVRAVHILHTMGIHNRILIFGGNKGIPSADLKKTVMDYYGYDLEDDEIYSDAENNLSYTDAIICTSWETAYIVKNYDNCISKFYFVQDFEPYFFAKGSLYSFAENTYKFGFRGITAGDWLKEKLNAEYGMETMSFSFSYSRELYHPQKKRDNKNRIFFYARPYTERRAFEVGVLAFEELKKRNVDFEVVLAGQKLSDFIMNFDYNDMGIMKLEDLSELYSQCDMCLVLSMTNLSLLPFEIMASNSVVISNKGENNEWLLNSDNSVLVDTDPIEIADQIEYFLNHKDELELKRKNGLQSVSGITWENEIAKVYNFIVTSVSKDAKIIDERNNE